MRILPTARCLRRLMARHRIGSPTGCFTWNRSGERGVAARSRRRAPDGTDSRSYPAGPVSPRRAEFTAPVESRAVSRGTSGRCFTWNTLCGDRCQPSRERYSSRARPSIEISLSHLRFRFRNHHSDETPGCGWVGETTTYFRPKRPQRMTVADPHRSPVRHWCPERNDARERRANDRLPSATQR